MLSPKRSKYRKAHKGRIHGLAKGGTTLNFGAFGLKALDPGRVTARQIEAARRAITRHIRRSGRVWIRLFPDVPVSTKPAEARTGRGQAAGRDPVCCPGRRRGGGMKPADIRAKTDDELAGELDRLGKEMFNLRFQRANGQLENTARVREVRHDIARIKTILGERRRRQA